MNLLGLKIVHRKHLTDFQRALLRRQEQFSRVNCCLTTRFLNKKIATIVWYCLNGVFYFSKLWISLKEGLYKFMDTTQVHKQRLYASRVVIKLYRLFSSPNALQTWLIDYLSNQSKQVSPIFLKYKQTTGFISVLLSWFLRLHFFYLI